MKDKKEMVMNAADSGKGFHTERQALRLVMSRQIRVLSETTTIEMVSNENALIRFSSYMNMVNAAKRK